MGMTDAGAPVLEGTLTALAERARARDGDAFVELVEPLQLGAYKLAAAILADAHEAQDAVQEATVRAWRNIHRLRDPATVAAWYRSIVVNECRRSRSGSWRRALAFGLHRTQVALATDEALELGVVVRQVLGGLSVDHRIVLVLHHYFDVTLADIADQLGVPLGTVKSRLSRAEERFTRAYTAATEEIP
jgi:RNA polymerase sigma factor (sigma-70 family)